MARKKANEEQIAFKRAYSEWIEKILRSQEEKLGLTGADVATRMKRDRHTYYLIRNGTTVPSVELLSRLGEAVEIEFSIQAKDKDGEIISEFTTKDLVV